MRTMPDLPVTRTWKEWCPDAWQDINYWSAFVRLLHTAWPVLREARFIIDGLDRCDESKATFLSELARAAQSSEWYFRVIVTSTSSKSSTDIQDALQGHPAIDLDRITPAPADTMTALVEGEVICSPKRPPDSSAEVAALLAACGQDYRLQGQILMWLEQQKAAPPAKEVSRLSPPSPERLFQRVKAKLLDPRRIMTLRTERILQWAVHGLRPLRRQEIAVALYAADGLADDGDWAAPLETDLSKVDDEVRASFGPLLVFENDELSPTSAPARDFLANLLELEWALPAGACHWSLASACLGYLQVPEVKYRLMELKHSLSDPLAIDAYTTPLDGVDDFFAYAIQYLPVHYDLGFNERNECGGGDNTIKITQPIADFYNSHPSVRCWEFVSGLDSRSSFFSQCLSSGASVVGADSEILRRAARYGEQSTVFRMLKSTDPDPTVLRVALEGAVEGGHGATIVGLLHHVAEWGLAMGFEWPPMMLQKLSWVCIILVLPWMQLRNV